MVRRRHKAVTALVFLLAVRCESRDDLDGRRRRLVEHATPVAPVAAEVSTTGTEAISLLDNRAAMVTTANRAQTVSAAGARLVPFIDGNLRGEWQLNEQIDGVGAALIRGRIANLFVPLDDERGGVLEGSSESVALTVHLRPAVASQVASVFVNEERVGDIRFGAAEWTTRTVSLPRALLSPGENRVRFFFRHLGTVGNVERTPGALAWLTVGGTSAVSSPSLVDRGDQRRSLATDKGVRLSFYMHIPSGRHRPRLVARLESSGPASAVVVLATGRSRPLWSGQGSGAIEVALDELAGDVVRVDLHSEAEAHWFEPAIVTEPVPATARAGVDRVDHIILWAISSLRADAVSDKTAALSRFRREALSFESAWSPAPIPGLAHSAVLTGRVHSEGQLGADVDTLATVLRGAGFATALISGNGFISDNRGFARGFDRYENPLRWHNPHGARVLWQLARRFVSSRSSGKTFVYVATSEPHLPYTPSDDSLVAEWGRRPAPLPPAKTASLSEAVADGQAKLTREQQDFIRALYRAEVRDADDGFAAMLADLQELELADRTAIVVFGDHGEELFEGGRFGHGRGLGDEVLRVPLMIRAPGLTPGARNDEVILADLYPTVLALAGVPGGSGTGRDLFADAGVEDRPLVFRTRDQWAIRQGRYKLYLHEDGALDLEMSGDPSRDLAADLPILARYLRSSLAFAIAFDAVWSDARWGSVGNHAAAFAGDQGL